MVDIARTGKYLEVFLEVRVRKWGRQLVPVRSYCQLACLGGTRIPCLVSPKTF